MKASHRKDVIIARIIFAIICAALLAGIISLIVWLHGRNAGKNQTPETEITNNAPPADNSNLPPVTEQPLLLADDRLMHQLVQCFHHLAVRTAVSAKLRFQILDGAGLVLDRMFNFIA